MLTWVLIILLFVTNAYAGGSFTRPVASEGDLTDHANDETNVHGITDTGLLLETPDISNDGVALPSQPAVNLIAGDNIEILTENDTDNNRVNVTIRVIGVPGDPSEPLSFDTLIADSVVRGCSTCFDESSSFVIGDGVNDPVKIWANAFGGFMKFPGAITHQLAEDSNQRWTDNGGADIIVIDEATRQVTFDASTASRCARFDANKKLVAASGDCSSGDTTSTDTDLVNYRFGCQDNDTLDDTGFMLVSGDIADACAPSSAEIRYQAFAPFAGTVGGLICGIQTAPGASEDVTFTVVVGGSDSDASCTISGAVTTPCSDLAGTTVVAAGDIITVSHTVTAGGADTARAACNVFLKKS